MFYCLTGMLPLPVEVFTPSPSDIRSFNTEVSVSAPLAEVHYVISSLTVVQDLIKL